MSFSLRSSTELEESISDGQAARVSDRQSKSEGMMLLDFKHNTFGSVGGSVGSYNRLVTNTTNMADPAVKEGIDTVVKRTGDAELRGFANWLSTLKLLEHHNDLIAKHIPGTGHWVLSHPEFEKWMTGHHKVLWCLGTEGGGKTFISAIVFDHLRKPLPQPDTIGFTYVSFDNPKCREANFQDLLYGILKELLIVVSSKVPLHSASKRGEDRPGAVKAFKEQLKRYTCVYLVVDALDKCVDTVREEFVVHLTTFMEESPLRVFITSVEISATELLEDGWIRLSENDADLRTFILHHVRVKNGKIKQLTGGDSQLEHDIVIGIAENVSGTFPRARFHLKSLGRSTDTMDLRDKVLSLIMDAFDALRVDRSEYTFLNPVGWAFRFICHQESKRQDRDKKRAFMLDKIKDVILVLLRLKNIELEEHDIDKVAKQCSQFVEDIKACYNIIDALEKGSLAIRVLQESPWNKQLKSCVVKFEKVKKELEQVFKVQTTKIIEHTNWQVKFASFRSPAESHVYQWLQDKRGVKAVISNDKLCGELIELQNSLSRRTIGGETMQPLQTQDISPQVAALRKERRWDVKKLIKGNSEGYKRHFEMGVRKLQEEIEEEKQQQQDHEKMAALTSKPPHERITDQTLQHIWKEHGWKASAMTQRVVGAIRDYAFERVERTRSPRTAAENAASMRRDDLFYFGDYEEQHLFLDDNSLDASIESAKDRVSATMTPQAGWSILQAMPPSQFRLLEQAFDPDVSGFTTISEVNAFLSDLPENWSNCLVFPNGLHTGLMDGGCPAHLIVAKLTISSTRCLGYAQNNYLDGVWSKVNALTGAFNRIRVEPGALVPYQEMITCQETRLCEKLKSVYYHISQNDMVYSIIDEENIDWEVFALLTLILRRHLGKFHISLTDELPNQELRDDMKTISYIIDEVFNRFGNILDIFRGHGIVDMAHAFESFSGGLFKNYFRWNAQDNVKYSYTSDIDSLAARDQVIQEYSIPEDILRHHINSAEDSDSDWDWDESGDEEDRWDEDDIWSEEEIWDEDDSLSDQDKRRISPGSLPVPIRAQELWSFAAEAVRLLIPRRPRFYDRVLDFKRGMELTYHEEHEIASESELRELRIVKAFTTPKAVQQLYSWHLRTVNRQCSFWCDACRKRQARGRVLCLDCYDAITIELCPKLQCIDASDLIAAKTDTKHCSDHLLLKHRDNLLLMDHHSTIERARECLQITQSNFSLNYQSIDPTLQPPVSSVKPGTLGDEVSISDGFPGELEIRGKHNCIVCHDAVPVPCWYCIECCEFFGEVMPVCPLPPKHAKDPHGHNVFHALIRFRPMEVLGRNPDIMTTVNQRLRTVEDYVKDIDRKIEQLLSNSVSVSSQNATDGRSGKEASGSFPGTRTQNFYRVTVVDQNEDNEDERANNHHDISANLSFSPHHLTPENLSNNTSKFNPGVGESQRVDSSYENNGFYKFARGAGESQRVNSSDENNGPWGADTDNLTSEEIIEREDNWGGTREDFPANLSHGSIPEQLSNSTWKFSPEAQKREKDDSGFDKDAFPGAFQNDEGETEDEWAGNYQDTGANFSRGSRSEQLSRGTLQFNSEARERDRSDSSYDDNDAYSGAVQNSNSQRLEEKQDDWAESRQYMPANFSRGSIPEYSSQFNPGIGASEGTSYDDNGSEPDNTNYYIGDF
ncbi:hypothetical protein C8J56DRAFT_1042583 [Mycena floridula]|nr:hypothetical protein C8J56DRAFT_1042583 [Mycena floridula]